MPCDSSSDAAVCPSAHATMPIPPTGLSRAWIEAEASVAVGCRVSGVERSPDESWRAWARPGPFAGDSDAAPIDGHGGSVDQALLVLARNARLTHGLISGEEGIRRIPPRPSD